MNFTPISVNPTFSGLKSRPGILLVGCGDALVEGASVCFASETEDFLTPTKMVTAS